MNYEKMKVIFRSKFRLNSLFRFKDSFEKKFAMKYVIVKGIVTARFINTEKPSSTFMLELLNTWGTLISLEKVSKTLNSPQYLTIFYSETVL